MDLSGLNKQIAECPGMVVLGMEQAKQEGVPITEHLYGEMQKSVEDAFRPAKILNTIGIEIKNNISESEANDLLVWYESDLGMVITKAEENASTPAAYQDMTKQAQSLLAEEKRVNTAQKIDRLVNGTKVAMKLQENTAVAVFSAISTAINPGQTVNIEAFRSQMSKQEQQMRANIEQLVFLSLVYSYKDIDKITMDKYIKFLERPITRKFNNSVINGMTYAMNQSIESMAKSLSAVFKEYAVKN